VSLFGALNLGSVSLAAQQAGLQVTGNNIANAGTTGYARQTVTTVETDPQQIGSGQYVGTGVTVGSVNQQVNDSLEASLRDANSAQSGASTLSTFLGQVQTTFGALNSNDLASSMQSFFAGFSTLSTAAQNSGQASVVIQKGVSLADQIQTLRTQLTGISQDANSQVSQLVTQANSLTGQIATLNGQISQAEAGGGTPNALLDQRRQALSNLSQILNISVVPQTNGAINVMVGSRPLVEGNTSHGLSTVQTADPSGTQAVTNVVVADSGTQLSISGGKIGGLIDARDNFINPAIKTLDTYAQALINTVNTIHSQGQGTSGFSSVTATSAAADPAAALNSSGNTANFSTTPVNGTFNFNVTDSTTGKTTTQQINVTLGGSGTQTTLNSLAASLTSGSVTASVDSTGHLNIQSNSPNVTFSFGNDTSGTLTALGINTFFTGTNAATIGVNQTLTQNSKLLATDKLDGSGNILSNANVSSLAYGNSSVTPGQLGGQSLQDFYTSYIGTLATQTQSASNDATTQGTAQTAIASQEQAYSGVNMDDESINLIKYQQAYQGTSRYISVVNTMMQDILSLITL